ncbi:MAG: PD-(D/E)XK motif protein [Flavobacterium sp.]|nr:MAG: PD-(D/E)XK motif protein [Flavobacterium sp.]
MSSGIQNPWQFMHPDTARRVDLATSYNFFWICNQEGRFGLLIHFSFVVNSSSFLEQMKGMSVVSLNEGGTKFYLVLHDKKEWEMFFAVCNDLITNGARCTNEGDIVKSISQRLKRWKKFLSEDNDLTMSERLQMGLFAELNCLKDIIPIIGYQNAIIGWVGPDTDQKDFSLIDYFLEIKSFMSSKGQNVTVSSVGQLDDEIKPVYLVAYALSRTENGVNIPLLVSKIHKQIPSGDIQIKSIFEEKLAAYGYYLDITKPPFSNYIIDSVQSYLIQDGFPRIKSTMLDSRISKVRYSINLGQCDMYKDKLPF